MEKQILKSVYFKKLKCLNDISINFSDTLTAIMGVNGSGKTTVIHAIACIYRPDDGGKGENHRFPEFFIPNTDSLWIGSEFHVTNEMEGGKDGKRDIRYRKDSDRWSPKYVNRPKRNVYYIGIDTCLPEVEKSTTTSRIQYSSESLSGGVVENIVQDSAYILNKPYRELLDNTYRNKHFSGVVLDSGLKYSSLSMGTGEQRVLKIIEKVLNAEAYSLILIDEIDLLLHISALDRLIEKLHSIAQKKHLQIVFTTHSPEMLELEKYVSIQYLSSIGKNGKTFVYDKISADLLYPLTGKTQRPIKVYVEDKLAAAIVKEIARKHDMLPFVEIVIYGSIENAFTLAASFALCGNQLDYILIVLDGDRYKTKEAKKDQVKKKLSGTEDAVEGKWANALSIIGQFCLPKDVSPEKYLHALILENIPPESEIFKAANEIKAVSNSHQWLYKIQERTGLSEPEIIHDLYQHSASSSEMLEYTKEVSEWLLCRRSMVVK